VHAVSTDYFFMYLSKNFSLVHNASCVCTASSAKEENAMDGKHGLDGMDGDYDGEDDYGSYQSKSRFYRL